MRRKLTGICWVAGAFLLLIAFRMGADWGSEYATGYGVFILSRGEAMLRLNLLLLVLPAALALAWGVAVLAGDRVGTRFDELTESGRGWDALLAIWLLASTWAVRRYLLQGAPVTDDENAYEFQAQLIETGRLFVPSLPEHVRPFLDNQFIVNSGRRYAAYFVGHPAYLALFRRLAIPDLAGPIATGATGLLAVATTRRILGARAAALAAGLLATSPMLVLLGGTHLSQPTTGLFTTTFLYALVRLHEEPMRVRWWALGAAAISAAVLTRPQTALPFFLVGCGAVALAVWRRQLVPGARPIAGAVGVGALGVGVLLWTNAARSGHPFQTSYAAYMAQGANWSFPVGPEYSIRQAAESIGHLQFWLFGWPVSLLFLPFFERSRIALLAAAMVGATALLYALVAIPTVAPVGPVYFGESIPILCMLSASGIERAVAWARERAPGTPLPAALAAAPLSFALLGLVTFVPPQVAGLGQSAAITRLPYRLAEEAGPGKVVVFAGTLPTRVVPPRSWAYYHRSADPDLRDRVIFVRDHGPDHDRRFLQWLGDRDGYVLVHREGRFALERLERPR